MAPGRPIDLIVAPGAAFLVDGDEPRLRQVIGNLVNNALTHTPPGRPVRVKIASGTLQLPADGSAGGHGRAGTRRRRRRRCRRGARRRGRRTGDDRRAGAARLRAVLPGRPARNRASGGTGLGLAIVAGLVAAHGGTVSVRTAPGQGADFQVRLPLSPDARVAEPGDADDDGLAG